MLALSQYAQGESQNISSILHISCLLHFLKSFRNTAYVELFNFQDPTQKKTDFGSYYIKIQSLNLPEKVAGNQNVCEQF